MAKMSIDLILHGANSFEEMMSNTFAFDIY